MEIIFTARHFELTDSVKQHVAKKLDKLDGMIGEATEARVVLSAENYRHLAEVTFKARGRDFVAAGEAADMLSAADQVVDRLERQLRRYKERRVRRRRDGRNQPGPEVELPPLTRFDQVSTRPMSVDEAIEDLDEHGGEYLVFNNTETSRLNVLYRRQDGSFGLIEPNS